MKAHRSNHSQNEFSTTIAALIEPMTTLQPVALHPSAVVFTPSPSRPAMAPTLMKRIPALLPMYIAVSPPEKVRSCTSRPLPTSIAAMAGPETGPQIST